VEKLFFHLSAAFVSHSPPYISISYDTHKQIVKIEHTKIDDEKSKKNRKKMNCWQWSHCRLLKTTNFESRRHHHIVVRYNRKNKRASKDEGTMRWEKKASKPRVKKLRTFFCSGCQPNEGNERRKKK